MAFKSAFVLHIGGDEYGKNLFPEVNMCNVGRYDRTGVATQRQK